MNAVCFDGNTPLHFACGKKNVGMVALLMAAGADPNMENADLTDTDSNCDGEETKKDRSEEDCSMSLRGQLPKDFAAGHEKVMFCCYPMKHEYRQIAYYFFHNNKYWTKLLLVIDLYQE